MTDKAQLSPADDDWEPPALPAARDTAKPPGSTGAGLDTKPYQPVLVPLDVPKYGKPVDHTQAIGGFGAGTSDGVRDQLTELSVAQEIDLLAKNNIYLNPGHGGDAQHGAMAAYVVGNSLEPARKLAVRFTRVSLRPPPREREDNISFSYDAFESHLQRQLVSSSTIGVGIPLLFSVDATYGYASSTATHSDQVSVHFAASQSILKALATFDQDDLTLDDVFVRRVETICKGSKPPRQKAEELLAELQDYGHFVPLSVVLGGRFSLTQKTELHNQATFEAAKHSFGAAASVRFEASGVPVDAKAGSAFSNQNSTDQSVIQQSKALSMELKGGDERLASSSSTDLGTKWISSLGSYREWRTIGFSEKSLVPIIHLLPPGLRDESSQLLSSYFVANLDVRNSALVGHASGDAIDLKRLKNSAGRTYPGDLARNTPGLDRIVVNADGNVDALTMTCGGYNNPGARPPWVMEAYTGTFGHHRGDRFDSPPIELQAGETITAIEAWVDPRHDDGVVRRLAFKTNRGARYPDATGFYGRNREPHDELKVIEAPRVRGLRGFSGNWVHSIGLTYLDLAANARSRQYLLTMEPFLFPTADYGPLGR